MKKIFGLLAIFLLFLIAVFAAVAMFPPNGLAKRLAVSGLRQATGLELQVNGATSLRLFPSISMRMEDVVVTNPATPSAKPVAAVRVMEVGTGYLAALGGSRTVERVELTDPAIEIEVDGQGRLPWQSPPVSRDPGQTPTDFTIGRIGILNGNLSYRDQRSGFQASAGRAQATLNNVSAKLVGEALVKAATVSVSEPGSGRKVEIGDLDARATAFDGSRFGALTGGGATLSWRDSNQPKGIEATKFSASAQQIGLEGTGAITFVSDSLIWPGAVAGGSLNANGLEASAKGLKGGRLDDVAFKSGDLIYTHPTRGTLNAIKATGTAKSVAVADVGEVSFNSGSIAFADASGLQVSARDVAGSAKSLKAETLDEITLKSGALVVAHPTGGSVNANSVNAAAKTMTSARIEGISVESSAVGYADAKRSAATDGAAPRPASLRDLQRVSIAAPVLASGAPIEAVVGFDYNSDRVTGSLKLPAPESIFIASAGGGALPASISLKSSRGDIDFDGQIATGTTPVARGKARATTNAVDALATWLGAPLPAAVKGAVSVSGDIDAQTARIALSNGRIEHGGNTLTGAIAADISGERPKLTGKIAAEKFDADAYLGGAPVKPKPQSQAGAGQAKPQGTPQVIEPEVQLGDVFKSYVRAMLDAPPKRGATLEIPSLTADEIIPSRARAKPAPGFAWSEEKFDLSALRSVDLDVEWSAKQLSVRGLDLTVPQLKTVLSGGTLTLEGSELASKDGKISGKATIDAREAVPAVSATFKGDGVDVYALSAALGITPMIEGDTSVEADIKSRGASQKQLVEGLSGSVKTNMPNGYVLGYDLGNITLGTVLRWLTGNREYDPERRTAISGLKADLAIDKGVVRESQVAIGGPLLGVNAEGTIGLVEQRLDYTGRARIASWFNGLPFKIFGDWTRPTFQPDLGLASVFSRSAPGEPGLVEIVAAADIKEDPELALMIGRVIQKAGPNGLDPATAAFLGALQKRALGSK